MSKIGKQKLKIKVYTVTFGLALMAIAIGVAINLQIKNILAKNLLIEYSKQESLVAQQVSENLKLNVEAVKDKLILSSQLPDISNPSSTEACNKALKSTYTVMENKVGNLGRVNKDGFFACSLNEALIGVKAETLGPYIKTIFDDPKHNAVMSNAIKPPGSNSWLAAVHVPVYDSKGEFNGTLGGALYFNQLQEKLLSNITFATSGFVVLFDENGDILYHPDKELIATNLSSGKAKTFYSENIRHSILHALKNHEAGTIRFKAENIDKLGAYRSVEVLPGHNWLVLVTVPVSEAEEALTSVGLDNGFLAFTIVLIIAIFAIAMAMLVSKLKSLEVELAKDEFLQLATHQLLTPVTGVRLNLGMLLMDENKDMNPDEMRKILQDTYNANEHQRIIINDMLNVARLESGRLKLNMAIADVVPIVTQAIEEQTSIIKSRKQKIEFDTPKEVRANIDAERLRMVIDNLISNASKYTQNSGSIKVSITDINNRVSISVHDSGVGLNKKDIPKLFKKFSRIDNSLSEERGGTGLGLYLAMQIIRMHGGNINVESDEGKGTKFTLELLGENTVINES